MPRKRKRQPTPVFLLGKPYGQWSPEGPQSMGDHKRGRHDFNNNKISTFTEALSDLFPNSSRVWSSELLKRRHTQHSFSMDFFLPLPAAASALTGPRLVSGEPGGAVTIQCRYPSLAINSHLRKYWCRLGPPAGVCRTVVSTNRYTHLRYRGRVALADFPKRGLFVVRLSRLSPEDEGRYRCGLGNSNNALFFSMNLTVSPGLSRTIPTATLDYGELITGSFEITSPPATKRCTRGNTQTTGRQRTGWDTVALTPGARKTTASATGRQTPGATAVVAPGTGSQVEGSVWATVPTVQSPASTVRGMTGATEQGLVWSTSNSEATRARASERERETTPGVNRPSEETDSVSATPGTTETAAGTIRPSPLASERWMWEPLQEETSASEPQSLGSIEGTIPAAAVWTSEPTRIEMASAEGSSEGDLDTPAGDGGPRVMPSQALAAGPPGLPTEESSVKSISLEEKNFSGLLTPVSSVLCLLMLVTLVLWKRKLQRKGSSQKTGRSSGVTLIQMTQFPELGLQPGQPPPVGRKRLQVDPPPLHASLSLPARDPGP
ncbi:high affinity immunoglobulin alpha and immunoglobulin mu Fc receptor isoform X1 [Bos javanicus]|uniref:high affinity immunoglobulin alpha and immunoglobulin mu Fc receptor isoform X1 n=1 Tax=Bos javanicus TaxID=9906 RepID=UPI002AA67CC7|nr:high affinity immunoglobulin alpha and immunoglobulin mu Fc receptor isoform X1 [Bos javanicus]